jgi:hypothetical protein
MDDAFLSLIEEVERKRDELGCTRSGAFFRGHSNGDYQLIPSFLRNETNETTEHNLYQECFARANHLISRDATSWERLAFFQHYGIPTRLLDWTESLAVALFFAVKGAPVRPHLWITNAFRLNQTNMAAVRPRIPVAGLDPLSDYYDCFIRIEGRMEWPLRLPIFLQIPWTTERLRAQGGFFTFHPSPKRMDLLCPEYLRRVDIPNDAFAGVRRFLELAGITEHTVFPDFVGLAGFMRNRYRV